MKKIDKFGLQLYYYKLVFLSGLPPEFPTLIYRWCLTHASLWVKSLTHSSSYYIFGCPLYHDNGYLSMANNVKNQVLEPCYCHAETLLLPRWNLATDLATATLEPCYCHAAKKTNHISIFNFSNFKLFFLFLDFYLFVFSSSFLFIVCFCSFHFYILYWPFCFVFCFKYGFCT